MTEAEQLFRTRSLYAAAYLLAGGLPLMGLSSDEEGRTHFLIGGDPVDLRTRVREYRRGTAQVNAQRFGSELRRLKAILHGSD